MAKKLPIKILAIAIAIIISTGCFEDEEEPLNKYRLTFTQESLNSSQYQDYLDTLEPLNITHEMRQDNITKIDFILFWQREESLIDWGQSELNMTVSPPDDANVTFYPSQTVIETAQKTFPPQNGTIQIVSLANDMPNNITFEARSPDEKVDEHILANGKGIWTVTLILEGNWVVYNLNLTITPYYYRGNISKI